MRIIGILILALELASLAITLRQECKEHGLNFRAIKSKLTSVKVKLHRWRTQRNAKFKPK
jgi:hypothetical protein